MAANTVGADGLCARTTSSGSTFYSFDLQGGTALRLDAVGNVLGSYSHDAYGNRTSTDNSADPYSGYGAKWGYYRDAETGLSLLGARYYDASQGRFLNRDPIGYDGGSNLYGYAGNNPISHIDPSGLKPCWADDDGSPRFDKCYQSDLQAGDHPGIKGAKDCVNFWAHLIPFYPLIPALTGQDLWGCSLTPQQRSDEADAGALGIEGALSGVGEGEGGAAAGEGEAAGAGEANGLNLNVVPKPSVADTKLGNIVNDLYHGAGKPGQIGAGSTADAIRQEAQTGLAIGGKFHALKGQDYIRGLSNWLRRNPDALESDINAANAMLKDLKDALGIP